MLHHTHKLDAPEHHHTTAEMIEEIALVVVGVIALFLAVAFLTMWQPM